MASAHRHSRVLDVIGLVLLLAVVYLGVGAYAASQWMKPRRDREFVATPAAFHLGYQDVWVPSRDAGIRLSGWWIPRPGSTRAILMVHGRGENRTTEFYSHFLDLAARLNTFEGRGFHILMIDLRAHGLSGGEISTWGIGERHDVEGAVDWIKSRGIQTGSIGALGASLGATSCVYATAEDPDISALVVDGAGVNDYPTIQRSWTRMTGTPYLFLPAGVWMERVLYGYDMRALRPVDAMAKIPPRPVLLVYGSRELPLSSDRRALLKAALPDAELWVVEGAAHTGAYTALPDAYLQKVGAFFEKNLK
ncbi:MAG TPA: alpha/beta fold hydrolase [Bryobacteraceae bacterium]|nr:alpha/beta fold hydrolase [Bryobacteraceae bacterium]